MNRPKNAAFAAVLMLCLAGAAFGAHKNPCVGRIMKSSKGKTLLETGDTVTIVFRKNRSVPAGTRLTAYRVAPDLMNTKTDAESEKRTEDKLGTLEILKLDGKWYASAKVVLVLGDLEPGCLVKPEAR